MNRIVFAGGGTAGHIEPAIAVAREWQKSHPGDAIIFLGTRSGLESRLVPDAGFELSLITKVKVSRKLSPQLLTVPFLLARAVAESIRIIRGADVLVGFGGYVSAPAYLAAAITRTPLVIHEANARPGIANRMGAQFTDHTAVAHPIGSGKLQKALLVGLPLKVDVHDAYRAASENWQQARIHAKSTMGFKPEKPLILIFGGSQGSVAINRVIADSCNELLAAGIQILHGVGRHHQLPNSSMGYQPVSYIHDMATAYLAADLVISRSGAVTCAEVNTLGRYALFIPLPIGNGEQEFNARDLQVQLRAEVISQKEFTAHWLIAHSKRLLAQSANAPIAGSRVDIEASSKMVSLIDFAIAQGS